MKVSNSWLVADRDGLAKLIADRSKAFLLYELFSNAFDEATTEVHATLEKLPGRPFARLIVIDNNPDGFHDLSHAYRLFAESKKKNDPTVRGRYNLGEKLVLALCRSAKIVSTSGCVEFTEEGTRIEHSREKTEAGSRFEGVVRMTQEEFDRCLVEARWMVVPEGITATLNGERLLPRTSVAEFTGTLPTVYADSEGVLRPTRRQTLIKVYEPQQGEVAMLYELGIPVVASGDRFHVDVQQKIPLNTDRDNVSPAFLQAVRTLVFNHTAHLLEKSEVTTAWVDAATRDKQVNPEALRDVFVKRFGEKAVAFDPSDPEANNRAASQGFTVIHGGTFDRAQWENIRAANVAPPAGRVMPTPKPYSDDPNAPTAPAVPPSEYTEGMRQVVALTERLAKQLMGVSVHVRIVKAGSQFGACYGARRLDYNLDRLGQRFFNEWQENLERVLDLMLDEFGHEYESNHLSENYYRALRRLGAKMAVAALEEPALFRPVEMRAMAPV